MIKTLPRRKKRKVKRNPKMMKMIAARKIVRTKTAHKNHRKKKL